MGRELLMLDSWYNINLVIACFEEVFFLLKLNCAVDCS